MTNSLDCNWSASLLLFLLYTFLVFTIILIANNFFHAITFFFRLNRTGSCVPFKSPQNNRKNLKKVKEEFGELTHSQFGKSTI